MLALDNGVAPLVLTSVIERGNDCNGNMSGFWRKVIGCFGVLDAPGLYIKPLVIALLMSIV